MPSERPIRVLHVTGAYPSAEAPQAGVFIRAQVESLRAAGVEVEVVALPGRGLGKYVRGIGAVRAALGAGEFDLVHAHYMYAGWTARLATLRPLVVSFMGNDVFGDCDEYGRYPPVQRVLHRALSMALARVSRRSVVKSTALGEALGGVPLALIPNGVDLEVFSPRAVTKAELGLPEGFVILFAGRPSDPVKRWPLAQATLEALRALGAHDAHLVTVEGRTQAEVARVMSAADALLLTSAHEGSPNVVKEALATELPVVSVDVGDVRERLHGVEGCHVVEAAPRALAEALGRVRARGERLRDGRASTVTLEWARERLIEVYRQVAG
jgi:teichuronic acid biosynthesis glycosyltransferase TuaC